MGVEDIWQATLGELELTLSRANFTTWFKNTYIASYEQEAITIAVPNTFTKAWLEKKYNTSIMKALQKITENKVKRVQYRAEAKAKAEQLTIETNTVKERLISAKNTENISDVTSARH